jgi:hypothetical protein
MLEEYPEIADVVRGRIAANLQALNQELGRAATRFGD